MAEFLRKKTVSMLVKPEELFKKLNEARWESCTDGGKNFSGVSIGDYCLNDEKDELCSSHVKIKIEHKKSKQSFEVEGWAFPNIFYAFRGIGKNGDVFECNSKTSFADFKIYFGHEGEKYSVSMEEC